MQVLNYIFISAGAIIFIYLYGKTISSVRRKDICGKASSMSSADYFCLVYSSLTLFNFIVQVVINGILFSFYGYEIVIIYTNITAIVCITLANMVPNRREEDMKIKLESTEQSLELKQAFVRYLSHEMRTPINVALVGLMMHQQYLDEKNLLTPECNEVLGDVKGAIDVALETLNEALDYEKLQSTVMALEKTREDPLAFVLSSTSMFKTSAVNAGVALILPAAAEVSWLKNSWIDIDIRKMSQVMRNLMSNALKFTPVGSSITVSMGIVEQPLVVAGAEQEGAHYSLVNGLFPRRQKNYNSVSDPWLEISVRDEGVGIEPAFLPRIFNEVLQINPNKNQGGKGTGMGLYISKGITELHGGRVEVSSDGLDQGSCFKILLPLHQEEQEQTTQAHPPIPKDSVGAALFRMNSFAPISPEKDGDSNIRLLATDCAPGQEVAQRNVQTVFRLQAQQSSEMAQHVSLAVEVAPSHRSRTSIKSSVFCVDTRNDASNGNALLPIQGERSKPPRRVNENGLSNNGQQLRGKRVLMVDDSPTNLKMCVKLLEKLGAAVDKAEDGRIAVERVRTSLVSEQAAAASAAVESSSPSSPSSPPGQIIPLQPPPHPLGEQSARSLPDEENSGGGGRRPRMYDFVLMDNQMPNMTGAEACKAMREVGFTGSIIGLTGNAFEQDIADYIAQGANAVLKKPLVLAEFFETLRQIDAANKV